MRYFIDRRIGMIAFTILAVIGFNVIVIRATASGLTTSPNFVIILTDDQDIALNGMVGNTGP